MEHSAVQPDKASSASSVPAVRTRSLRLLCGMLSIAQRGKVALVMSDAPSKAVLAMFAVPLCSMLFGMVTVSRDVQPENAFYPMRSTPSAMVTELMSVLF